MYGYASYASAPFGVAQVQSGTNPTPDDTTAPILSAPGATATGPTTANGTVTTNEAGGLLYYFASTSPTATAAQTLTGTSKTVTAAGAQSVSFTGLPAGTVLYPHYLQCDGAATPNQSAVVNGAAFTTQSTSPTPQPGTIDATKVSANRVIAFPGNKRVVTFPGNKREVKF